MSKKSFQPANDKLIYQKYNKKTLQNKIENKLAFQHEFGFITDKRIPLCCITTPLSTEYGAEILEKTIEGILKLNIQLVIIGVGTSKYQTLFSDIAEKQPHKIQIVEQSEENTHKIYAAADMGLILKNNNVCQEELGNFLQYGIVPICLTAGAEKWRVTNYRPANEEGEGFLFEHENAWELFAALVRACETYHFPYDFQHIQSSAMELTQLISNE